MAIDTLQKRQSALSTTQPPGTLLPEPDGGIDAGDRSVLLGQYSEVSEADAIAEGVPMDEIVRLFKSMIESDAQLLTLMGPGPGQVRWYYQGLGKVVLDSPNLAYITYTYSQPGNTDSGVGFPIILSIIWARERARCGQIRSRMAALFDKKTLTTDTGRRVRGRFMHEQDGYQSQANLAGRQAHFRFAYLDN